MALDIKTLLLMNLITSIAALITMSSLWKQHHKRYKGLSLWLLNVILQAISIVLFVLRGIIPDFFLSPWPILHYRSLPGSSLLVLSASLGLSASTVITWLYLLYLHSALPTGPLLSRTFIYAIYSFLLAWQLLPDKSHI